jgi:hypothetical protein
MRTFGTFVVAGILALTLGCGGGSDDKGSSSGGRDPANGGACPASTKGQVCTGEEEYANCVMAVCGTQYKTCFGESYASGVFAGSCGGYLTCMMSCPCDATAQTCETGCTTQVSANAECMTCLLTLASCVQATGCTQPVCQTTATSTSTATQTSTGTGCAALQACCAAMPAALASSCQSALTAAGGVDTTCSTILTSFQSAGYCI